MKKFNSKDALVAQFKNYEIDKNHVLGGAEVTGGRQDGKLSYIDQYDKTFGHTCDTLVSSHDEAGWIDHIYDDNKYKVVPVKQ